MSARALTVRQATGMPVIDRDASLSRASESQRAVALLRKRMLDLVYARAGGGVSFNQAARNILAHAEAAPDSDLGRLAADLGRGGKLVAKPTLYRWHQRYQRDGLPGLIDNYRGSERRSYGWEAAALRLYRLGSRPNMASVAKKLQRDGHESALEHRVTRYLKSLTPDATQRGRLGPEAFKNAQRSYVRRESPPVGAVYQGDGHRLDIYLQHPSGARVWRPELTLWMDVGSRKIVGWWVNEDESGHSTLFALGSALTWQNHLPLYLHIDNGSGYKNRVLSDDRLGIYTRLGIEVMHARPYNAKAKGNVERWFGTMERQLNKFLPGYCGPDNDDESGKALMRAHRQGSWQPLTLNQWLDEFTRYIEAYHDTPHGGLGGKTPNQMWAELERFELDAGASAQVLPSKRCHISREGLRLHNREYTHPVLRHYNGQKLPVEWSVHDDSQVRVLTDDGRWICDAPLVRKAAYLPDSRLDEAVRKREAAQIKRLEQHAEEKRRRAGMAITQADVLDGAASLSGSDAEAITHEPCAMPDNDLDLLGPLLAGEENGAAAATAAPAISESLEDPFDTEEDS